MRVKMDQISMHADNPFGEAHPAIDVKYYGPSTLDESDYEMLISQFWDEAQTVAIEHGYSGVFSEGRCGGWLVPYFQRLNGKLQTGEWKGQGPELGYPSYPSIDNAHDRKQFLKFKKAILQLFEDYKTEARNGKSND